MRKRFFDDTEVAQEYTRDATKLLDQLKQQMRFAGLKQLTRRITLPNGVTLVASSAFGQDSVQVRAPRQGVGGAAAEPEAGYRPYLWIGARIVDGPKDENGTFKNSLHVCVWEAHLGADPTILSNRNDFASSSNPTEYPLGMWTQFAPADDPNGVAYTDDGLCMYKKDNTPGLKMHAPGDAATEWDIIFVSDPDNDLNIQTGPVKSAGAGRYLTKVMVVGADCHADRFGTVEVELKIITGKYAGRVSATHRFKVEHFTSYKMGILPKGWFPYQYPPDPNATICDTAEVPVPDYGDNPHGPHWWQGMATAFVPAAQEAVPADTLVRGSVNFSADGKVELPPTGFAPADWFSHFDLCPAMTSVTTLYGGMGSIGPLQTVPGGYLYTGFSAATYSQRGWDYWYRNGYLSRYATILDMKTGAAIITVDGTGEAWTFIAQDYDTGHSLAPFKYVYRYDQHGNFTEYAEYISMAEWLASFDPSGRQGSSVCTRVEQDD